MAGSFQKATELYRKGDYNEVIRLLEPQIFRFRDSVEFYYYLGMSCLFTQDVPAAMTYLQRSFNLGEEADVNTMLGLAMVHLHRQENADAIRYWLRVLEHDPKNQRALKGLEFLRSEPKQEIINDLLEEGRLDKFLPQKKNNKRAVKKFLFISFISAIVIISGFIALPKILKAFDKERPNFNEIVIDDLSDLTNLNGNFLYVLTEDQIESSVERLNKYLLDYDDNLAMREINRINYSNAHGDLKNRIFPLEDSIRVPSFADFKNNFSYDEVSQDPYLHNHCYILWRGRATNVNVTDEVISFDFLVGYEDEKILEGVTQVLLDFSADVTSDFPMELLARVVPVESKGFYLEGISLHRIF